MNDNEFLNNSNEAARIQAEEEAKKQAQKEAEEKALREAEEQAQRQAEIQASKEAEERAIKHAAKQQELESVFAPEQAAVNNGKNIVKQVSENPQNKNIYSNVDDLLRNNYERYSNREGKIKADLIKNYNEKGYSVSEMDRIHAEALEINKAMNDEAIVRSYLEWDDGSRGIAESPVKGTTNVEDIKIEYSRWADNGTLKSTSNEVQEAINKVINSTSTKDEALEYIEQNLKGDTKYSARRIVNDSYEYAYEPIHANKRKIANEASEKAVKEAAEKNLKKSAMRNLGHVANGVFAVMDYKDAREAGDGVVKSVAKAGMEFAKGELLGGWYMAAMLAKSVPTMAISAVEGVNTMSRSMNSMQRRQVFGDANFQDTQQLATMRQSGMELAKMSQYNLQQAMMGNEAEYMHRL